MDWALRRIALLTSDFALYHDLVRFLRERRLSFDTLAFGEIPGPNVGVILTSWRDLVRYEMPEGVPVVAVGKEEELAAPVAEAERVLEGVTGYHEVVVGIDPGKRPGVAVLGDGRVLHAAQVFAVRDVAPLVRGLLGQFPSDRASIRLGHGAPRDRDEILVQLRDLSAEGVRVEVVDETGTTPAPGTGPDLPSDVAAAIRIARTPGRPARKGVRLRVSKGQIREIQRESRIVSGGRLTISCDRAVRVGRGELELAEAVEEQAARKTKRNQSSYRTGSKG